MTNPSGAIATAFVRVMPDTARFTRQLTRDLRQVTGRLRRVTIGVSIGGLARATSALTRLNLALRTTISGFTALTGKAAVGGIVTLSGAALELSGSLLLIPGAAAAGGIALGTLKIGLIGVKDAFKNFNDPEKFAESLKGLSTNARRALLVLNDFRPQLSAVRDSIQNALFLELDDTFRSLAENFLPRITLGFTDVALAINQATRDLGVFLTTQQSLNDFSLIVTNTARSIRVARPAGVALAQIFRDIAVIGAQFLPLFVGVFTSLAVRLSDFISSLRESGQLADIIARGINALHTALQIVVNVGISIASVMAAARNAGISFLNTMEQVTGRFARFLSSPIGQDAITRFLENARIAAQAIAPVFGAIGSLFANQILPILANFAQIVAPSVVAVIDAIRFAVAFAEPGIVAFAHGFGNFLDAMTVAIPSIGKLAEVLGTALGQVLSALGPILAQVVEALAVGLTEAFKNPALIDGVIALATAFGDMLVALAPLLPDLAELAGNTLKLLADILGVVAPLFIPLLEGIVDVAEAMGPLGTGVGLATIAFLGLGGPGGAVFAAVAAFGALVIALEPVGTSLGRAIEDFIGFATTGEFVQRSFTRSSNIFAETTKSSFDEVGSAVDKFESGLIESMFNTSGTLDGSNERFDTWWRGVQDSSNQAGTAMAGFASSTDTSMTQSTNAVGEAIGAIRGILNPTVPEFRNIGAAIFGGFAQSASSGLGSAVNAARVAAGQIGSALDINAEGSGSAIGNSLARGMLASIAAVRRASLALAGAAGSGLPKSPAEIGPFSGRGWTPFRGRALTEGFAEGIISGIDMVRSASIALASAASFGVDQTAMPGVNTTSSTMPLSINVPSAASTTIAEIHVEIGGEVVRVIRDEIRHDKRDTRRAVMTGVRRSP